MAGALISYTGLHCRCSVAGSREGLFATALHKILPYLDELRWPMASNDWVMAVFGSDYINGRCMWPYAP